MFNFFWVSFPLFTNLICPAKVWQMGEGIYNDNEEAGEKDVADDELEGS